MNTYLIFIFVLLLSSNRIGMVKMLDIGTSLLAKLRAEPVTPETTSLITRLSAILALYATGLTKWKGDKSRTKGKVDAFSKIVLTIPLVVDGFKTTVKSLMSGDKNVLLVLFGNNITIFYTGSQADIIRAFQNLHDLLNDYPLLAGLQTDVAAFIVQLKGAYDSKLDIKGDVKIDSSNINDLHKELGSVILGTFGRLIDLFRTTPNKVERFFDRTILKRNEKDPEKLRKNEAWVEVPVGDPVNAENVTLYPTGYLTFKSETNEITQVWTAPTIDSPIPELAFEIPEFGKVTAKVTNLGSGLNHFLFFKVKEGVTDGKIKVAWTKNK